MPAARKLPISPPLPLRGSVPVEDQKLVLHARSTAGHSVRFHTRFSPRNHTKTSLTYLGSVPEAREHLGLFLFRKPADSVANPIDAFVPIPDLHHAKAKKKQNQKCKSTVLVDDYSFFAGERVPPTRKNIFPSSPSASRESSVSNGRLGGGRYLHCPLCLGEWRGGAPQKCFASLAHHLGQTGSSFGLQHWIIFKI